MIKPGLGQFTLNKPQIFYMKPNIIPHTTCTTHYHKESFKNKSIKKKKKKTFFIQHLKKYIFL